MINEIERWLRRAGAGKKAETLLRETSDLTDIDALLARINGSLPGVRESTLPESREIQGSPQFMNYFSGATARLMALSRASAEDFAGYYDQGSDWGDSTRALHLFYATRLLAEAMAAARLVEACGSLLFVYEDACSGFASDDQSRFVREGAWQAERINETLER